MLVAEHFHGAAADDRILADGRFVEGIVDIFGVHDLPPGCSIGDRRKGELHSFVGGIHNDQETVVNQRIPFRIALLQGSAVQHERHCPRPFRIPCFLGHLLAVGVIPCDISHDGVSNGAVLEELAAMEVGMGETQMDETSDKFQKPSS